MSSLLAETENATPRTLVARVVGAVPHLVVAAMFVFAFAEYVSGDIRITPQARTYASWVMYELLAVGYAAILPLALTAAGVLRLVGLFPKRMSRGDLIGCVLLLVPFAWFAWTLTDGVSGRGWMLAGFFWLAFGRFLSHRLHGTPLEAGGPALARAFLRGVRMWGLATAAFLLSAFLVLPIEPILGLEMPGIEHGQVFMMLGMGVLYYLLNAVVELLPWERWVERRGMFLHPRKRVSSEEVAA